MNESKKRWHVATVLLVGLTVALTGGLTEPAHAAKGGKGGGGDKGGGKGGGDVVAARITFADELGNDGNRISGDGLGAYVHGYDGVDAFIGTGGAEGDIFLWLADASRGLWLDFGACYPNATACTVPFAAGINDAASISVAPSEVRAGGLYGMAAGETIDAPMHVNYDFNGPDGPGFVYYDPNLKGRNPCKNKSMNVSITRPGAEEVWVVSADLSALSCGTLPGGDFSGQYQMPFEFTLEALR